jgi:hypothetical protein
VAAWEEFARAEPDLAGRVGQLFTSHKHHTMATIRGDGGPRISGTEVQLEDGELRLGMMAGTRRAADLRRDPRIALHCHSSDPPEGDPEGWTGEAKISGRAVEESPGDDGSDRFRVDLTEVVLTRLGSPPDHLVIELWRPDRGLVRIERR